MTLTLHVDGGPEPSRRVQEEISVLAMLSTRVRENAGWQRRGVRGWMITEEFRHLPLSGDRLPDLAARGLIRREDVRDPGRKKLPLYINRITQAGETHLAEHEGRDAQVIPLVKHNLTNEDLETVFMPARAWRGLDVLIQADPAEWIPTARLGHAFFADDRKFLETRRLIDVQRPATGKRSPLTIRATELARKARVLDTTSDPKRVQVHIPGIRG